MMFNVYVNQQNVASILAESLREASEIAARSYPGDTVRVEPME